MVPLTRSETRLLIRKELKAYGIKKASLFGSFRRGEDRPDSDIDLIIEPTENMSLMGLAHLKGILEEKTGRVFDILTYRSIDPRIRSGIIEDSEEIL
jgi:predicted nucleotidyltransferase